MAGIGKVGAPEDIGVEGKGNGANDARPFDDIGGNADDDIGDNAADDIGGNAASPLDDIGGKEAWSGPVIDPNIPSLRASCPTLSIGNLDSLETDCETLSLMLDLYPGMTNI